MSLTGRLGRVSVPSLPPASRPCYFLCASFWASLRPPRALHPLPTPGPVGPCAQRFPLPTPGSWGYKVQPLRPVLRPGGPSEAQAGPCLATRGAGPPPDPRRAPDGALHSAQPGVLVTAVFPQSPPVSPAGDTWACGLGGRREVGWGAVAVPQLRR